MKRMIDEKRVETMESDIADLEVSKQNRAFDPTRVKNFSAEDFTFNEGANKYMLTISASNLNPNDYDLALVNVEDLELDNGTSVQILLSTAASLTLYGTQGVIDIATSRDTASNAVITVQTDAVNAANMIIGGRAYEALSGFNNDLGAKEISLELINAAGDIIGDELTIAFVNPVFLVDLGGER